jgi:hypothetical protein
VAERQSVGALERDGHLRTGSSTPCRSSTTSSTRLRRTALPLCKERSIGIIARVPFDEGSPTGALTAASKWPEWRLPGHSLAREPA